MVSLHLNPLPGAATATLCSETLLQAFQSQPPPILVIIFVLLALRYLSLRVGPLLLGLTTASSSTSYLRWRYTLHYQPNSQHYFLQQGQAFSHAYQTALQLWCKIFIAEISFWLGIALVNSVHLQEQITKHTRVPEKLSENSRAEYLIF